MSNKNMTAVEWLFDKITQNQDIRWRGTQYEDLFEQAKAMEKEQMIQLHNNCTNGTTAEQYYKENYEL
jgi:hypothetical protein